MRSPLRSIGIIATVVVAAGCSSGPIGGWTYGVSSPSAPAAAPAASTGTQPAQSSQAAPSHGHGATTPGAVSGAVAGQLTFHAFDMGFEPANASVDVPGLYEVVLTNDGTIAHDITFADGTHIHAESGESATGTVTIPAAGLGFICSIAGHADAGMKGRVAVGGTTAGMSPAASGAQPTMAPDDHGGPGPETDVQPDPNAPPPVTYDAAAPPLMEGETHDIELVMTEREMTVAPGFVQMVWTFGDQVPGPVIRVKVGDELRVHLVNPATNTMAHSIDFHASMVAWNDEMRSIAPGEELVYEWTAKYAGVWMYHCGTSPALHHIANGMYGMVIVEPKEGLP